MVSTQKFSEERIDYSDLDRVDHVALEKMLLRSCVFPPPDVPAFLDAWLVRLKQISSEIEARRLVRLLIDAASSYYLDGRNVAGALDPISWAIRLSEQWEETALLRRALSIQGLIYAASRKTPEALSSLMKAMDIADRLDDATGRTAAWINVGVSLFEASLYAEARVCYQRAEALADVMTDVALKPRLRALALHGVALSSLWLGESQAGIASSESAIRALRGASTKEEVQTLAVVEAVHAHHLLALGRTDEAALHTGVATELAEKSGSRRARVTASLSTVLLDVHSGRLEAGVTLLESIIGEAAALPGTHLELLRISIEVYGRAGRPDVALKRLHELMMLNREGAAALLSVSDNRLSGLVGVPNGPLSTCLITARRAAELEGELSDRLANVLNAAITTGLRSGHDHYRVFRLGALARCFGLALGWSEERVDQLALAVRLCDLGMIIVPDALLRKASALSPSERKLIEDHTRVGPELLAQTQLAVLEPCLAVARFHHERWDGNGPWSLAGEEIPIEARIASLCDVLDAWMQTRPWRPAVSLSTALREVEQNAGTRFDPVLAHAFTAAIREAFWRVDDFQQFLRMEARESAYVRTREQIASMVKDGSNV